MQFNSLVFIIFGAIFFCVWPMMRRRNTTRWGYLVTASFVFYGWWDWRFLLLIIFSGLIDYCAALGMQRFYRRRRLLLTLSVIGNIGSLAVFKYLDFGINNLNWLLRLFGAEGNVPAAGLILPVGISFYTFQSMSYTIDVYRRQMSPTRNVLHFFAYLALFPQLVAGPIVRARELLPQLATVSPVSEEKRWDGLCLIVFGFFKKVVVADTLAPVVNTAFAAAAPTESAGYWWVVMTMFAFQIFCDFSGYSDIARGLGKWIGYEFPVNFENPYIASSFREFWQRWHISLSTWFRDYVYIPLGGSKRGRFWSHLNMWTTMLISGLWHGAAWHFLLWALMHSVYLSVERATKWPERVHKLRGGRHLATVVVFAMTVVAWVFFRADNFTQALGILGIMFNPAGVNWDVAHKLIDNNASNLLMLMIGSQLFFYFGMDKADWATSKSATKTVVDAIFVAVLVLMCVFMRAPSNTFIYFQF